MRALDYFAQLIPVLDHCGGLPQLKVKFQIPFLYNYTYIKNLFHLSK